MDLVEEETSRRSAWKVDVRAGGWRVFWASRGNRRRSQRGVWLTRTVRRKTASDRRERSNLELIDAVSWRKNEDDVKMDGASKRRSRDDGQGLQGEAGDGGTCSSAEESIQNT